MISQMFQKVYYQFNNDHFKGIGYIKKVQKNKIQWTGEITSATSLIKEINELHEELKDLEKDEKKLDFFTEDIQHNLDQIAKSDDNNKFAYVSFEDIQTLANFNEKQK